MKTLKNREDGKKSTPMNVLLQVKAIWRTAFVNDETLKTAFQTSLLQVEMTTRKKNKAIEKKFL